ncbi:MAG: alcohol dehydrogenase catalytic domain-containing protein [Armatimonadota bacterium]|nr:alcohol dehydrogenase catalytic domain-containing protein [Armatimonadota bacterium]
MKSKGLYGKKFLDIQQRTIDLAAPDEDHVIVKIRACGVCGTDVNFVRDWEEDHMPLGHEIAGEVVEVGKNVRNVKPGDKVIVEDCTMCGICVDCKSGHSELCRNMYDMEGQPGMGEYMSVRFNSLDKFDGLDYVSACLTEPLAVALTSVQLAEIPVGASVAVLGNGPLGLMAARLAKLRGASFVAVTGLPKDNERERARFSAAEKMGCDLMIEVGKQDVADELLSRFPKGVDRVIVSAPPESIYDALKVIRFGGIITFFGLHFGGKNTINVDVNDLIFRKITLRPAFAEPAINFPVSIRLLQEGIVDAKALITHTFSFDKAVDIFKGIIDGTQPIVKAVMTPNA